MTRAARRRCPRRQRLQALCEYAFCSGGTVLNPAFSTGHMQVLLCELDEITDRDRARPAAPGVNWNDINVVVGSPLAVDFTAGQGGLKAHRDHDARTQVAKGPPSAELRATEAGGPG